MKKICDYYLITLAVVYTIGVLIFGYKMVEYEMNYQIGRTIATFISAIILIIIPPMCFLAIGGWLAFFFIFRFMGYIMFIGWLIFLVDGDVSLQDDSYIIAWLGLLFAIINTYASTKSQYKFMG